MKATMNIVRWTVGVILLLASIAGFAGGDIALSIFSVILGLLLLPPIAALIKKKTDKPDSQMQFAQAVSAPIAVEASAPVTSIQQVNTSNASVNIQQQQPASNPLSIAPPDQEEAEPIQKQKSGGLLSFFSGWGTAIKAATSLEACIKKFPEPNPSKLASLLKTKSKWGPKDAETIRLRLITKYDTKVNAENVEELGPKYLALYQSIFPEQDGHEIRHKININKVEAFLFTKVNDDEALDPAEIAEVISFSKSMNVPEFDSVEKIREDYHYYISNWELDNGKFKGIEPDFLMDRNELCLYKLAKCELVQRKSVTRNVSYGGASYRMKLGKGLSYRVGSYNVSSQKETVEVSQGFGILNVTNKRVFFKGKEGVVNINTAVIVDLEPFKDAVIIHKTTGKPISINTEDGITLYKYLRTATRRKH